MKTLILLVTALAVAALALPTLAHAKVKKIKVTVEPGQRSLIDLAPTQAPGQPLTPGDVLVVTNHVFSRGKQVGTAYGVCFTVAHPLAQCSLTTTLPKGSLSLAGLFDATPGASSRTAIVGGTGAYRGARGEFTARGNAGTIRIIL